MVYTRDETSCSSVQARTAALSGLVQYPRCVKRFLCATRAAGQVPRASHCRLRRLSPLSPGDQREIALDRSPLLVGRSAKGGADIILDDVQTPRLVSSKHAVLRFVQPDDPLEHPGPGPAGAGWEIIDLDSANGTAVNGENVRHAFLRPGDRVVLGPGPRNARHTSKLVFVFESIAAGADEPLASTSQPKGPGISNAKRSALSDADFRDLKRIRPSSPRRGDGEQARCGLEGGENAADERCAVRRLGSMGEDLTCPVCQALVVGATSLQCAHIFCQRCLMTWLRSHAACPVCRQEILAMQRPLRLLAVRLESSMPVRPNAYAS